MFNQLGIKHKPAVIIQGGNEGPFNAGIRSPKVVRSVMFDEFTYVIGQNLPVMGLGFIALRQVKAISFGITNDCW